MLTKGVKSIFPSKNLFPVTKIAQEIMENTSKANDAANMEFLYYDPKSINKTNGQLPQHMIQQQGGATGSAGMFPIYMYLHSYT